MPFWPSSGCLVSSAGDFLDRVTMIGFPTLADPKAFYDSAFIFQKYYPAFYMFTYENQVKVYPSYQFCNQCKFCICSNLWFFHINQILQKKQYKMAQKACQNLTVLISCCVGLVLTLYLVDFKICTSQHLKLLKMKRSPKLNRFYFICAVIEFLSILETEIIKIAVN